MSSDDDDCSRAPQQLKIALVGPCGAGKTTIRSMLREIGYAQVRQVAQEHSFAKKMWQRLVNPDVLIYLHVTYENTIARRQLNWTHKEYEEQLRRLSHAHQHADLIIDTNPLTPQEVLERILTFIKDID